MNIALFSDCYTPIANGVVTVIKQLISEFQEKGHHTVLAVPSYGKNHPPDEGPHVFRTRSLPYPSRTGDRIAVPHSQKLQEFLREHKIDIIHLHTEFALASAARKCSEAMNIPLVYTSHTRWEEYRHYLPGGFLLPRKTVVKHSPTAFRSACRGAVALSPSMARRLEGLFPGIPVQIIPNGINRAYFLKRIEFANQEESFPSIQSKAPSSWQEKPFRVLYVGRMNKEKSVAELARGLVPFLKADSRREAVFLGSGKQISRVRSIFSREDVNDQVFVPGSVPWEDIPRYYCSASVFVTLSQTEVHPMTVIESLTAGLPLIALKEAGLEGMIQPGENGWLLPSSQDLAPRLEELAALPAEDRRSMGQKSREISRQLDSSVQADRHLEFYQKIIDRA